MKVCYIISGGFTAFFLLIIFAIRENGFPDFFIQNSTETRSKSIHKRSPLTLNEPQKSHRNKYRNPGQVKHQVKTGSYPGKTISNEDTIQRPLQPPFLRKNVQNQLPKTNLQQTKIANFRENFEKNLDFKFVKKSSEVEVNPPFSSAEFVEQEMLSSREDYHRHPSAPSKKESRNYGSVANSAQYGPGYGHAPSKSYLLDFTPVFLALVPICLALGAAAAFALAGVHSSSSPTTVVTGPATNQQQQQQQQESAAVAAAIAAGSSSSSSAGTSGTSTGFPYFNFSLPFFYPIFIVNGTAAAGRVGKEKTRHWTKFN